ncbi:ligand-binding sensor domain-containing protein [Kordia jejudonensis]|uniref:ligand-binding sensor domain-containing protein n=1 Tax=Kordia jejudonensis TaxID=1348245 RepID=UPI0012E0C439|nr:two-component regulator propeller domain-containing protein [Kordia jejudonensis]
MKHYQLLIFLFFGLNFSQAQEYTYKHFSVDDGLPSSQVYDIYQDKQGYMWFATDKGLSRYNGYEFKNFTTADGLPDNIVLDFFPQKNGQIWCFGYESKKLFYFNENFDGFKEYQYNDTLKPFLKTECIVKSLAVDENNSLYLGGYYFQGFIEVTKDGKITNYFDKYQKNTANIKRHITLHRDKNICFIRDISYKSSEKFLNLTEIDTSSSRIKFAMLNEEQIIAINTNKLYVFSKKHTKKVLKLKRATIGIKPIDDTYFFVGFYNNGSEVMDVSGKVFKKFLPKKSITNLFIDAEGSYWFSTLHHGVFYLKNPEINILTTDYIHSLTKDTKGILYAGLNNGNIFKIHQNEIDTIYKAQNTHKTIVEYDTVHNHLYSFKDRTFTNLMLPNRKYEGFVRKIPENVANPILKMHTNKIIYIKNDSLQEFEINEKLQDVCVYRNSILIGTSNGLFIKKDSLITKETAFPFLLNRIDDIDINRQRNTAYIATHGEGIVVYGDHTFAIDENNGLTSNLVNEVYIENDNIVWACTNAGLNRISFKPDQTFSITNITKDDGLPSNDITDLEIINDTVWVATKQGLCYFKKDILTEKNSSKILSLNIQQVKVNAKTINEDDIKLPYDQNDISFSLQAISQKNTNKINYIYRLKEVDANWISTKNRNIRFPSLSPGNYTFQVKASVLHVENDKTRSYKFKIMPPFWNTWWFYGICTLIFAGIVYLFFKIRVLTYNKDIIRELIRLAIKRLKRKEKFLQFRSNGEDFKIPTHEILYVKSQGNYLDITTEKRTYTIRCKIGEFINTTPDTLEYLRIHRSYIIRIDQVSSKGKNWVVIKEQKIPVGETYLSELEKIQF